MHSCVCIHGMQSLRNGLILVLEEGYIPFYILVKEPFWDSYKNLLIYFNIFV